MSIFCRFLQFEAELFVDGLLGIGAPGGKSPTSTSEGAVLASRLEVLRKERAARAPEVKKKAKEPVIAGANRETTVDRNASPRRTNGGSKRSNRKKKGKR